MEGNEGSTMTDGIHINRMVERFPSHPQTHRYRARPRTLGAAAALRQTLIAAAVEVVAEGNHPRLGETRVPA